MKYPLIAFVRLWRALISPLYGNVCKYHPSCSAYGLRALQSRGAVIGSLLTIWRILRCNPWSLGGCDPVPGTPEHAAWLAEQAAGVECDDHRCPEHSPMNLSDAAAPDVSHYTRGEN
ncbi:membrane protein insertion efficiency factor YidD [Luteococcus sp. H138]|uniref:membrane protein insertion efficiency factor YidD n=1 Tax=unclassified Luteococcus TaxID=2639923 RepID=UPI00406C4908